MGSNTTNTSQQQGSESQFQTAGTQSSQTVKDPYAAALPYMDQTAQAAQNYFNQNGLTTAVYDANTGNQAWKTPFQTGQRYLTGSPNGITAEMQTPLSQLGQIASGANSISMPTGALTETQQAILDQNAVRMGNRLASQYSGAGRYGSFGAGEGMARGVQEMNNPLMAQYNQQNIQNSLAQQQQNIANQMGAATGQLGQYNTGIKNMQAQMALQPGNLNLAMAPALTQWQNLQNYSGALSSMYPMFANAGTITQNSNTSNTGSQTGTTNTTGGTSTPTPWTTYAGLGLAGIGALSDRRVKTDIKKVGRDPWNGLSMYEYRYKGQPKNTPKFVGPMAQEVREIAPEAVGELPGGILYIKKAA